ncbi:hypothetical protein DSL72_000451 [Monilinia vaccinii-corymbosi]|uniref:Uncharacterized protein n=1 Tax=Monilinia vaccinii-corymbosi TaxID=61207 RepID=A0A8A3NZC5_9HELO|nr:hypothetical protein DSL72_000451 [Monilinia vaccinii-corymbosi]
MIERVRKVSGAFLQAVGNVFSEALPHTDHSLTPAQSDALIKYQRQLPRPMYLGELAFFVAEIVDMESSSVKIHKTLIEHGMISEAPITPPGMLAPRHNTEDEIPVKTSAITKNFPHQLAPTGLSMDAQKSVLALLYFWLDEWKRWCRLQREERDVREQIERAKRVDNRRGLSFFSVELNKVLRQKKLLWTEREENREAVGSPSTVAGPSGSGRREREESIGDQLPSYGDSIMGGLTIQVATGGAARVMSSGGVDELPSYGELTAEGGTDNSGVEETLSAGAIDESSGSVDDHSPSHQKS